MAYMRGEPYIWSDGEFLHIWSESGNDGWQEIEPYAGEPAASGVQLAEARADEFAVMRFAELVALGQLPATVERALQHWGGNFGVAALRRLGEALVAACTALVPQMPAGESADFARLLGYGLAWFQLGLVDQALLDRQRQQWAQGEDRNTEHYRHAAFQAFLAARRPLGPELVAALYELGAADADPGMGGSMMHTLVRLPECPQAVLDAALASGRKHLVRAVQQRSG